MSWPDLFVVFAWIAKMPRWIIAGLRLLIYRRAELDRRKLQTLLPRIQNLVRALRDVSTRDTNRPEVHLSQTILAAVQPMISDYCGGALVSLKVLPEPDATSFLCLYPPELIIPPELLGLRDQIGDIALARSYAGLSHRENRPIYEPDLAKKREQGVDVAPDVLATLKEFGVSGLVVYPIRVAPLRNGPNVPAAVLKVDFCQKRGIVENKPTRELFGIITEFFSFALQLAFSGDNGQERDTSDEEVTDDISQLPPDGTESDAIPLTKK